jgi:hypothetical protein
LDALALLLGYILPMQRLFQLSNLAFAAFDHPFPPNQIVTVNHSAAFKIRHHLTVNSSIQPAPEMV